MLVVIGSKDASPLLCRVARWRTREQCRHWVYNLKRSQECANNPELYRACETSARILTEREAAREGWPPPDWDELRARPGWWTRTGHAKGWEDFLRQRGELPRLSVSA